MNEKINISDIVVTTMECKYAGKMIPQGSYFEVETIGEPIVKTGSRLYHMKGTKRIFSDKEIKSVKTFALCDIVRFKENMPGLGFNNTDTWLIQKVVADNRRLEYVILPTKPSGNGDLHLETVGPQDLVGVNCDSDIKVGNRIVIINNGNDHKYKVYTVERVYTNVKKLFYAVTEIDRSFMETEIRIWEDKDDRIRHNFYKLSELLRKNEEKLLQFRMADDALAINEQDRNLLQSYYDEFMDKRILEKATLKRLNQLYKENIDAKKNIEIELQKVENQDVKNVI